MYADCGIKKVQHANVSSKRLAGLFYKTCRYGKQIKRIICYSPINLTSGVVSCRVSDIFVTLFISVYQGVSQLALFYNVI